MRLKLTKHQKVSRQRIITSSSWLLWTDERRLWPAAHLLVVRRYCLQFVFFGALLFLLEEMVIAAKLSIVGWFAFSQLFLSEYGGRGRCEAQLFGQFWQNRNDLGLDANSVSAIVLLSG